MFTINPFAELSATISPFIIQVYILCMIFLVVGGTLIDTIHKGSARYFFNNWRKSKSKSAKKVGGGEMISIAVQTAVVDVMASGEFCNMRRRIAHLLTMYGFIIYAVTTFIMVFWYPTPAMSTPAILPQLWWLGALAVCVGGYWFWFFIRVDVAAEGNSPFRVVRADLFILSLLASVTLALAAYVLASTVLFGTVLWSKFAHMFFKPAAAFEKRMSKANGTRNNLPEMADRNNPADRDRHSMGLLKDAPLNMGLGIKREKPRHY
jgi:hypothetical protein